MAKTRKAIRITKTNKKELESRFRPEGSTGVPLALGYFLLADFNGADEDYDVVTPGWMLTHYTTVKEIDNGFSEVRSKD